MVNNTKTNNDTTNETNSENSLEFLDEENKFKDIKPETFSPPDETEEIIRQIVINNNDKEIEFLKFDLKENVLTNKLNLSHQQHNKLLQNAFYLLNKEKQKSLSENYLSDDSETILKALKWFKVKLLKEISKNRTKTEQIDNYQIEIRENKNTIKLINDKIEEKQNELKTIIKNNEMTKTIHKKQINDLKEEIEKTKSDFLLKQTKQSETISKLNKEKNETINLLKTKKSNLEENQKKTLSKLSKDFKIVLEEMEQKKRIVEKENEKIKTQFEELKFSFQNSEKEKKNFIENLKKSSERLNKFKDKKRILKNKIEVFERNVNDIKQNLNAVKSELKTEQNCHALTKREAESNFERINAMYKKVEKIQNELFKEKTSRANAEAELKEVSKILEENRKNKTFANKSQKESEHKAQEMRIENIKLKQSEKELKQRIEKLKRETNEIKQYFNSGSGDKHISNKSTNEDSLESFLKTEIKKMKTKLEKETIEKNRLLKKVAQIENQNQNPKTSTNKLQNRLNKVLKDKEQSESTFKAKIKSLQKLVDELEKTVQNKDSLFSVKKLRGSLKQIEELKSQKMRCEKEIVLLKNREKKNKELVEALKEEIRQLEVERNIGGRSGQNAKRIRKRNNLFEVYGDNSKKAKNIIDEELLKLKRTLDENIYSKERYDYDTKSDNNTKNVNNKNVNNENNNEKNNEKKKNAKINNNKEKRQKLKNKKLNLFDQRKPLIENKKRFDDTEEIEQKRLTLRERIEMSKNL